MSAQQRNLQVISLEWDPDNSVVLLRTAGNDEFLVTNAGHAQAIRKKVSAGGRLSTEQLDWLERYRSTPTTQNRARLRGMIKSLRQEIKLGSRPNETSNPK